ncbi:hypothetical protein ACJZ2D_009982 [Fusarium nematophilum]
MLCYPSNPEEGVQVREKHGLVWSKITQKPLPDTWMLLGPRLQALYNGEDSSDELVYLALVCLEWEGDLQYDYSLADLRAALLPHRYNKATCEAKLNDSNIVVNIWSWAKQDDATAVTDLYSTLLFRSLDYMKSYLILNDNGDMHPDAWEVWAVEHRESCTVMTERQHFYEGIAALAGRRKGRFDVLCPIGRTWCFFEWDGQPSVDGLGRFQWLLQAWEEHEACL